MHRQWGTVGQENEIDQMIYQKCTVKCNDGKWNKYTGEPKREKSRCMKGGKEEAVGTRDINNDS